MKRILLVAMMSISMLAFGALAQQSATTPDSGAKDSLPSVEEQLKVLNEKLDLTAGQQAKIKPILQHLHDATENLLQDDTLSREARLAKVRPQRLMADKKLREILSDEQKKKLDQYEKGPHPEMHGTLSGTAEPPARLRGATFRFFGHQ
jgi:Spy/CpxP family protein refolding chaperone